MDDAALIAVEASLARDAVERHARDLLLAIDRPGRLVRLCLRGHQQRAAVARGFGGIAARDEDRRAQHLGVAGEPELERRALGRYCGGRVSG